MEWVTLILLLLSGIILIVIEIIFVPGTTILGIIGFALLVFGIIIGYSKFGPQTGTIILISTIRIFVYFVKIRILVITPVVLDTEEEEEENRGR